MRKPSKQLIERATRRLLELGLSDNEVIKLFSLNPPDDIFKALQRLRNVTKSIGLNSFVLCLRNVQYLKSMADKDSVLLNVFHKASNYYR